MTDTPPLLFCDIDNVLLMPTQWRFLQPAVDALAMFKAAGFLFVLHSTWRAGMREEAQSLFAHAGFEISSFAPVTPFEKRAAIAVWLYTEFGRPDDWPRCVVIDDAHIEPMEGVEIVRIDPDLGLTPIVAREIIRGFQMNGQSSDHLPINPMRIRPGTDQPRDIDAIEIPEKKLGSWITQRDLRAKGTFKKGHLRGRRSHQS